MISIFSRGGALRFAAFFLMLVALSVSCGSSEEGQGTSFGARFLESQNTSLEAPGYASDPRIVLSRTVGTSYTVTVTEGGSWCWTSRNTHATSRSGSLVTTADVVYLYLAENDSGAARTATVRVAFDGGLEFDLTLSQPEYSIPAVMDHPWAELPAYKSIDNCTYVTHYAPISSTQPKARNFTICYDRSKRIALWVAVASIGARNLVGALPLVLMVNGIGGFGFELGALTGHGTNYLIETHPELVFIVVVAIVFGFAMYNFVLERTFSFDATVAGVEPVQPVRELSDEAAGARDYDAVCARLAAGHGLTAREAEVLPLLARGRNVAYIMEELTLSRNTIKSYVARVYGKLDVHSHQELIDLVERTS